MVMIPTTLELTDLSTKWVRVVVTDKNGIIEEEFEITSAELDRVKQRDIPLGKLRTAWETKEVMIESRPCLERQCVENPESGTLMVNTGKLFDAVTRRFNVTLTAIPKGLWENRRGVIWIDGSIFRQLGALSGRSL